VKHETILYTSDGATNSDSVITDLEANGYDVVSTDSSTKGVALLYIMHSIAAVVLHHGAEDRTWFKLAQTLRAILPSARLILLSRDPILCLPPWGDACVGTEQPLKGVACGAQYFDRSALRSANRTTLISGLRVALCGPGDELPPRADPADKKPNFSLSCLQI
jgi:hypothetical protein